MLDIVLDAITTTKDIISISGNDYPIEIVMTRFLELTTEHISYVFMSLDNNTRKVRNIKKYLLATLFSAPTTMDSYYKTLVNHDLHG